MKAFVILFLAAVCGAGSHPSAVAGPYAPAAGQAGSDGHLREQLGHSRLGDGSGGINPRTAGHLRSGQCPASFGLVDNALGKSDATIANPNPVVSLGDGGHITLSFATPITNGPGADFAVFENGFADSFLELAFVEVSSDGTNFFRFPSHSLTSTGAQVASFGTLDTTNIDGLAGKYRAGFGTPFDLPRASRMSVLCSTSMR